MKAARQSRYVKIKKERGYGDDIFHVRGYNSRSDEFMLQRLINNGLEELGFITIYRAHCYVDMETAKLHNKR